MMAFASLLAQCVWADVVTTWPESGTSSTVPNDTIVFRGITLEQLKNDYAIGAKMGGIANDHIGSAKWAAHVIAASSDTELKVQFQLLDGNFLKWTTVKFVQDTDGEETVIKATQLASTRAETSYQNDWSNYLVLKTAENGVGDKTAENYPLTWLKLIAHTYDSTEAAVSITDSDTLNIIRSSGDTYTFKGDNGVTLSFGSTTEAISSRLVFQGGATTTHEFTYSGNRGALFGRGATFDHPTILVDTNAKLKFNAHDLHGWESSSIVSDSVIRVNNGGVLTCNNPGGTSHYAGCLYLEPGSEMNIHGFGTDNFRIHGGISDTVQQVYVPSPADGSEVTVAKITGTGVYMSKDGTIGFGMNIGEGSTLEISAPINAHANTDKCKKFGAGELKISGSVGANPWVITAEGKTTIASGNRQLSGTQEVLTGATLSFTTGDAVNYDGKFNLIASGVVNFNNVRQTFFNTGAYVNTLTLNPGAHLKGVGDQHGAIDLCDPTTITLGGGEGEVTIEAKIRYRDSNEFATFSTSNEAGAKVVYKNTANGSGGIAIGDNVEIEFVNVAFAHAIKGSGRATFTQKVPAAGGKAKFATAADWTGDVMLKNIDNLNSSQGGQAFDFTTYGNASSTITCDGAAGWLASNPVQSELKLVGSGFCVRDGSSGSQWCYIFNKISGAGPFKCDYGNDGTEVSGKNFQPIHIKDASEFTGVFWTDCSGIWITDSNTTGSSNGAEWAKKIIVDNGKTVTMGAEWTAPAGIYVNGNVTANCGNRKFKSNVEVGSTGTLTMSASDLINYDATSDQTIKIAGTLACGDKRQSFGGHNKLVVVAGATLTGEGDGEGAIDNFGGSKITVEAATGDNAPTTVDWSAAVRYRSEPEFAIADGVTVNMSGAVMSESTYAKTVNKTGAGTLNLTGSVSAYITHKLSEGKITSNSATLNVTSGVDGKVVRKITADGVTTYDLAVAATITIPSVDHTTVAATVNGVTVDPSSGSLSVYVGDTVVVTYSAAEGYMMTDKVVNLDVTESTTIDVEGVSPQLIIATVNGAPYASLADAKAACTGTETIVIVSNLEEQTYFARSSDYTNVGAIEIATGVTVNGYFQESGSTIPLVINGTFEITNGFSGSGQSATIPNLSGTGKITKSWNKNPVIYVQEHTNWNPSEASPDCIKLSVAKSGAETVTYYYTGDENAIISALRNGTEVTNIGYTAETVPDGLVIDGDKLVLATYTVELKTFDHTVCYAKINTGDETEYTEALTVKYGDAVYFRYVAAEGYRITSTTTSLQYTNIHANISGGTYTIETELDTVTITIPTVANMQIGVTDGNGMGIQLQGESTIVVTIGSTFTVTYTPAEGYAGDPISTTYENASSSTEVVAPAAPAIGVVQIGTKLYGSLQDAVAAAETGATIKLLADISVGSTVTIGASTAKHARTLTIDFAEHTVTQTSTGKLFSVYDDVTFTGNGLVKSNTSGMSAWAISAYGTVIIDGVSVTDIKNNAGYILYVAADGAITLKNGTITSSKPRSLVNVAKGGAFTMQGGSLASTYDSATSSGACVNVATGATANIEAGEISGIQLAVWVDGTANISGGTITAKHTIWVNKGTVNISGGTIKGAPEAVYNYTSTAKAYISGGTFESTASEKRYVLNKLDSVRDSVLSVTGGTFKDFDPSNCISEGAGTNFVADGYESVKDGNNYRIQVKLMPEEPTVDEKGALVIPTPTGATKVEVSVEGEKISDGKIPLTDTGLYTVTAKDSNGIVVSESQIGVVVTTKKTGTEGNKPTVAVAVPFTGATVANLLNTTNFADGDQLKAFINGAYAMWTFKEGKWTSGTTVLAEGLRSAPNADTTPLARGSAVWVTTAGQVVAFGAYESTAVEPEVVKGYNLIGNPMMTAITPEAKTVGDVLIPVGGTELVRYKVIDKGNGTKAWKCHKSVSVAIPGLEDVSGSQEVVTDDEPTVEVGGSVWLIK